MFAAWDGDGGWGVSTKNKYYKDCSEQVSESDAAKPYRIYYLWQNPTDCAFCTPLRSGISNQLIAL